ncbi:hypothetical protein [Sorangium sp. So ce406]|uniref:hypothetical protein n=1 Tax=Sorangium sp. So ce406 TaxID=3133311 RepID=UPI003F5BF492
MKISPTLVASFVVGFIVASGTFSSAASKIRRYHHFDCHAYGAGQVCTHVSSEDFTATEAHEVQVNTHFVGQVDLPYTWPYAKVCVLFQSIEGSAGISCGVEVRDTPPVPYLHWIDYMSRITLRYDQPSGNELAPWHDNPAGYPYIYYYPGENDEGWLAGFKVLKD